MSYRRSFLLLLPVILTACSETQEEPNKPQSSHVDISTLQELAESSCQCERKKLIAGSDTGECWLEFKQETKDLFDGAWATACAPVSTEGMCLPDSNNCITTGYNLNVVPNGFPLCTEAEAKTFEATYYEAYEQRGDEYAIRQLELLVERLKSGEDLVPKTRDGGCTG